MQENIWCVSVNVAINWCVCRMELIIHWDQAVGSVITGSGNILSLNQHQAIAWVNDNLSLTVLLEKNLSKNLVPRNILQEMHSAFNCSMVLFLGYVVFAAYHIWYAHRFVPCVVMVILSVLAGLIRRKNEKSIKLIPQSPPQQSVNHHFPHAKAKYSISL